MSSGSASGTEDVLAASRALLGVVARSLSPVLQVTRLDDYRALVILAGHGPTARRTLMQMLGSGALAADESIRRLSAAGMLRTDDDVVALTPRGRSVVDEVSERRRREIAHILASMKEPDRTQVARVLAEFARAAGEVRPEESLILGL